MQYVFSALGLLSRLSLFVVVTPDEIMQIPPHVQRLRVQGKPVIIARKLRYFADREFDGLHRSPDAQPANPKSEL